MRALAKRKRRRAMTSSWEICWLKTEIEGTTYCGRCLICFLSGVLFRLFVDLLWIMVCTQSVQVGQVGFRSKSLLSDLTIRS